MKKTIFFSIIFIALIAILFARAQGSPLQSLTDSVAQIQSDVSSLISRADSLQTQVNNLHTLIANPAVKQPQYNIFLFVDGIPGESKDDKHKDWIDVLAYSHGMSSPVDISGGQSGKVNIQDFSIVKVLDKASPKFYQALTKGEHIKEVKIELIRTSDKQKYMEYKLEDAIISSIQTAGSSSSGDSMPSESLSINFAKIEWRYTEFDEAGKPKDKVEACWDIKQNRAC